MVLLTKPCTKTSSKTKTKSLIKILVTKTFFKCKQLFPKHKFIKITKVYKYSYHILL